MRSFGVVSLLLAALIVPAAAQAPDPRLQRSWQLSFESDARRTAGDLPGAERLAREAEATCPRLGNLEPSAWCTRGIASAPLRLREASSTPPSACTATR